MGPKHSSEGRSGEVCRNSLSNSSCPLGCAPLVPPARRSGAPAGNYAHWAIATLERFVVYCSPCSTRAAERRRCGELLHLKGLLVRADYIGRAPGRGRGIAQAVTV